MTSLILGDCLEKMKDIADGSIDLVLTDPPYGTTACKWDTCIPFEPMWEQLKRITKKNGAIVLFGSQPFTSVLVMSNPKMFKYEWVWNKALAGNGILAKIQPLKIHENIMVFSSGKCIYNPIKTKGVMVILHRAIQQYRTKYGVGQLYLVKRLAMRISLLEYPKQDNPERREVLLTY